MNKQVLTVLPNEDYDDLYKLVKQKGRYSEKFDQDKVPTQFWIDGGCLYSQLKGDLRIKKVLPIRDMPVETEPASGLAKALDYLCKKYNRPMGDVLPVIMHFYVTNEIPKSVELPQEILDQIRPANIS